ncbi:hypothetical protein D3C86_2133550 [compost metagenome]
MVPVIFNPSKVKLPPELVICPEEPVMVTVPPFGAKLTADATSNEPFTSKLVLYCD